MEDVVDEDGEVGVVAEQLGQDGEGVRLARRRVGRRRRRRDQVRRGEKTLRGRITVKFSHSLSICPRTLHTPLDVSRKRV